MVLGVVPDRKYSNSQMVEKVHFALLQPHIQHCITSWGCAAKSVLDPLIRSGLMTKRHDTASSMPFFHKANLLPLNHVFKLKISKLMHNIENNEHLPDYISKSFERVNWKHKCNTRHSFKTTVFYRKLGRKRGNINALLGTEDLARNSTRYEIKSFTFV